MTAFNRRKLTHDADILDALAVLASVYSRQFQGGFLFGMPELFFGFCIGWQPEGRVRRRIAGSDSPSGNRLPSWSWEGWEGHIELEWGAWRDSFYVDLYDEFGPELTPLIQWYKSSTSDGPATPVCNDWKDLQCAFAGQSDGCMPVGWRRITQASGVLCYEHEQILSKQCRWPLPLGNDVPKPAHDERFLRFRAVRG